MQNLKAELMRRAGPYLWRLFLQDAESGQLMAVWSDDEGKTTFCMPLSADSVEKSMPYLHARWVRARLDDVRACSACAC